MQVLQLLLFHFLSFSQRSNRWVTTSLQAAFNAPLTTAQPALVTSFIAFCSSDGLGERTAEQHQGRCKLKRYLKLFILTLLCSFLNKTPVRYYLIWHLIFVDDWCHTTQSFHLIKLKVNRLQFDHSIVRILYLSDDWWAGSVFIIWCQ